MKTEIGKKKSNKITTTTVWINSFLCCLITNILAEGCFIVVFHSLEFMLCLSISDFLSMACDSPYSYPQWCAMFSVLFLNLLLLKRFNNNNAHFYLQLVKIFSPIPATSTLSPVIHAYAISWPGYSHTICRKPLENQCEQKVVLHFLNSWGSSRFVISVLYTFDWPPIRVSVKFIVLVMISVFSWPGWRS